MTISEGKLRALVATDEGQYHDRKSLLEGPPARRMPRDRKVVRDQIAEYVAGFANADGGILILGVEDDGTVTGHRYPPDQIEVMLSVPEIRLAPPQPRGQLAVLEGVEVVVFEVESAISAVQVVGDGYPYRVGDSTMQWSEEKINAVKTQGLVVSAEARPSRVSLAQLDEVLVARAIDGAGLSGMEVVDYIVKRRLADRSGTGLVLRQAAELLFAREDHVIDHPNAGIRVFRVTGTERLTGARHNVQEFSRIEGSVPTVLERGRALLETLIRRSTRLHDLFFQEMPEYPTFAWQEALVNAVAHRDYAVRGQAVEVWLYDDRLEVLSPGGLPPDVSLEDLRGGKPAHASRNPRIARVLAELGVMRDQGEGIPRIFDEMEISFLPLPVLDVLAGRFSVVLKNEPIFGTDDPEWSRAVRALPLAVTQKRALVGLVSREFANSDYCELNGLDRDGAYRELHELVERGFLVLKGSGKGARYSVVRQAVPTAGFTPPLGRLKARMSEVGFVTNTDYREAFEVDRRAAKEALAAWTRQGVLVREGEKRGTRYRPGAAWPPSK